MRFPTLLAIPVPYSPGADARRAAISTTARSCTHPAQGSGGMDLAQDAIAARSARTSFRGGGNAVDAAVAVGFAEAVTLPRAGNLGGGGFLVAFLAAEGKAVARSNSEIAPANSSRDMFLGADGEPDPLSRPAGRAW
ncbi:MAG: gamma-glutamyltransferase [Verrucomicrobiales bacterium]